MADSSVEIIGPAPRLCVEHGGAGEFLIFMHGVGGNRSNWRDQLPVFSEHFHAAAWDARGYGNSDDYDSPLDFADFANDLARVLDHFGVDRAHLAGLSMGGRIAMDFAVRFADRVRTLTLIDTHPGFSDLSEEEKVEFVRLRKEPLEAGKEPADIAEPTARTLVGPNASPQALQRLVDSMTALHKESYIKAVETLIRTERQPGLAEIAVPTHVIVGAEDRLTPPEIARELAATIRGARLTVIDDAGHLPNIERPEEFNAAALSFLLEYRHTPVAG